MKRRTLRGVLAAIALSAREDAHGEERRGPNLTLPEPRSGLLPDMTVPRPAPWESDLPMVHAGYSIRAIATDLRSPRHET